MEGDARWSKCYFLHNFSNTFCVDVTARVKQMADTLTFICVVRKTLIAF